MKWKSTIASWAKGYFLFVSRQRSQGKERPNEFSRNLQKTCEKQKKTKMAAVKKKLGIVFHFILYHTVQAIASSFRVFGNVSSRSVSSLTSAASTYDVKKSSLFPSHFSPLYFPCTFSLASTERSSRWNCARNIHVSADKKDKRNVHLSRREYRILFPSFALSVDFG